MNSKPWSSEYWERRYAAGHNSGAGSYGKLAEFKAEFLNRFVADNAIRSVMELGCGDGAQLDLARYPDYVGYDVSDTVLDLCRRKFERDPTKRFYNLNEIDEAVFDLALSLDVIYHLIENPVFHQHMRLLFDKAERYVIIYASNTNDNEGFYNTHVLHRVFTDWVEENAAEWVLAEKVDNIYPYDRSGRDGSFADFYVYRRASSA